MTATQQATTAENEFNYKTSDGGNNEESNRDSFCEEGGAIWRAEWPYYLESSCQVTPVLGLLLPP